MLRVTPITVGVGNKENPFPAMRGADRGRGKHFPFRIIPDRGQILQDGLNPCGEQPRHVFNDDISRPDFFNESRVFMPQPASFSRDALSFPRCRQAHVLAREAPAQYIDRGQIRPPQFPDILIYGDARPVPPQYRTAKRIDLAKEGVPHPGPFQAEIA
ncbi:hypothetical protein Bwad006_00420 [Bilophila wadsworthia]